MDEQEEWRRRRAVQRYLKGEKAQTICTCLGRTGRWLYKWLERYQTGEAEWYREHSRRPIRLPSRTPAELEEIVKHVRLQLYNRGEFCGAQAIRWQIEEEGIEPLPSIRTIGRILARLGLTHRRTGRYEPKGKSYPALDAPRPGFVHQSDFVGPCYLRTPIRFYSLNSVDLATGRCAVEPVLGGKDTVVDALWATWLRLGFPKYQQVDNEAVFYGSPRHPRGMGKLIRLCLPLGIRAVLHPLGRALAQRRGREVQRPLATEALGAGHHGMRRGSQAGESGLRATPQPPLSIHQAQWQDPHGGLGGYQQTAAIPPQGTATQTPFAQARGRMLSRHSVHPQRRRLQPLRGTVLDALRGYLRICVGHRGRFQAAALAVSRRRSDRRTSIPATLTGKAFSEAWEVYHPMFRKEMGSLYAPHPNPSSDEPHRAIPRRGARQQEPLPFHPALAAYHANTERCPGIYFTERCGGT